MHLDVQCFFPRVWCNDLPTGSANHQVDLDDFTIRIMGIITVCLSPWNFLLNVSNDFFFWGEGSYSSVAKGSTNVNVVVLNLGFRTGFCTSPAFIPAYAHPQKDTNVIQSVYQVSHFSATILLLYSWMFLVYFPDFWCRRQQKSSPGIVTAGGREPVVVAQVAHVSRILMVSRSNFWVKRWFHQQEWWTNGISWGSAGISADGDSTLQQPDMAGTSSIFIHFVIFFVDDFPFQCPFTVGIPAWPCLITVW